jgi:hypothetical protein
MTGTLMGIQRDRMGGFENTRSFSRSLCSGRVHKGLLRSVVDHLKGIEREARDCLSLTLFPLKGSTEGGYTVLRLKGGLCGAS